MTCSCAVQLGDVGTVFKIRVIDCDTGAVIPIDAATTLKITFKKPDKTIVTKTAVFSTDGTDGYLQYITIVDDMDQVGIWTLQGYVAGVAFKHNTAIGKFTVADNL